jgi:DNA topoisomerase IA
MQTETNRGRTGEGKTGRGTTEGNKKKQIEKQKERDHPAIAPLYSSPDREEKQKRCPQHAITIVFDFVYPHQVSSFSFPAFLCIIIHMLQ